MAKTNEEILEAVRGLDPKNDEHWTTDGMPRLDAVENLLGGDVSRKSVTNAAPNYTRAVASELVDAPQDGEPPVDEPPVESDAPETVQQSPEPTAEAETTTAAEPDKDASVDNAEASGDPFVDAGNDDPLAEGPGDEEAEYDARIEEARVYADDLRTALEQGRLELLRAEQSLAEAIQAKNDAFPPLSPAAAIQQFQRSEQAKRARMHGLGGSSSPLDAAMNARRKARRPSGHIG